MMTIVVGKKGTHPAGSLTGALVMSYLTRTQAMVNRHEAERRASKGRGGYDRRQDGTSLGRRALKRFRDLLGR